MVFLCILFSYVLLHVMILSLLRFVNTLIHTIALRASLAPMLVVLFTRLNIQPYTGVNLGIAITLSRLVSLAHMRARTPGRMARLSLLPTTTTLWSSPSLNTTSAIPFCRNNTLSYF
ncbi:hypothetical protein L210DRAFT_2367590 [Boletus edulis BED1]|uniref:Uncharacterized protein n=1 Tax=Boletus edulis BED1 TaxID=1328754 RepID=A0AAD4BCU9_BOLED|nr:hypothetical protein L210DRAFT_2367590 [Boletus edulis BED1]